MTTRSILHRRPGRNPQIRLADVRQIHLADTVRQIRLADTICQIRLADVRQIRLADLICQTHLADYVVPNARSPDT